ncbi:8-oxo-dGTP pyrophosphatase MutT (NUDIX family) [Pseudoduganella lurida]|uniref:8-oxo-dGTP pyrophosphatase MutT (NUDIX family) n=1 Tax=Pseudoduganella lurida TaxID=1036180 RepID=A0A562RFD3_9BURK|nr:NUDIX domain-containing protein [Pseudoduganella lurida]TWI67762.1 8-oxo-dGTP pyrophosphatase MutT (NUDIX family) [Pseudoduganella lurida]
MISVDLAGHRFQLRAAAVIAADDFILIHRMEGHDVWALPGGRVDPGESGQQTVVREFGEELGVTVQCGALLFVVENFFNVDDKPCHEIGLYFRATLPAGSPLLDKTRSHPGVEGRHRLEFKWVHKSALADAGLRPLTLCQALCQPLAGVQHIVQRD